MKIAGTFPYSQKVLKEKSCTAFAAVMSPTP